MFGVKRALKRRRNAVLLRIKRWMKEAEGKPDNTGNMFSEKSSTLSSAPRKQHKGYKDLVQEERRLLQEGDILSAMKAAGQAAQVNEFYGTPRFRKLQGVCVELSQGWLPELGQPAQAPTSAEINERLLQELGRKSLVVYHLLKGAWPFENNGGATRTLNILQQQKGGPICPTALLPIGYQAFADKFAHETEINGIPHVFFSGINDPKSSSFIPNDKYLQWETHLNYHYLRKRPEGILHAHSGRRGYELALKALSLKKQLGYPVIYEVRSFHEHTWGAAGSAEPEPIYTTLRKNKENECMVAADAVVTLCQTMRRELVGRGVSDKKIHVVPNGVSDEFFEKRSNRQKYRDVLGLSGIVIGYISNIQPREGQDLILRAIADLRSQGYKVSGLIVGEGQMREKLYDLRATLGLEGFCAMPGEIPHEEIQSYYDTIDIFVVPRRKDYAADFVTPMKPFEAMARRLPLVMSDRPALLEIAEDVGDCVTFRSDDSQALASACRKLLDDSDARRRMGTRGYDWCWQHRRWSKIIKYYDAVYRCVLADGCDQNASDIASRHRTSLVSDL